MPGKAVFATIEGRRVEVGSPRHAAEVGAALPAATTTRIQSLEAEGKTVVVVLSGGAPLGLLRSATSRVRTPWWAWPRCAGSASRRRC